MNPREYCLPYDSLRERQVKAFVWIQKDNWLTTRDEEKV